MNTGPDLALAKLLPAQRGAFSHAQALERGFTQKMINNRVRKKLWHRLDTGVFTHSAYAPSFQQRCMAALLKHPAGVLAGLTAAAVHQLEGFRPGPIEIALPPEANARSRLATVRRTSLIRKQMVDGFRVNNVALTLIDVAGRVPLRRLERAFEDGIVQGKTSFDAVANSFVQVAGSRRQGLADLRTVLVKRDRGEVPPATLLEALTSDALDHPEVPELVRQAPFPWRPHAPNRVDLLLRAWWTIIEADGRRWHARLQAMETDYARDRAARQNGYLPLRYGWVDLRDDPASVRKEVVAAGSRWARGRAA